MFQRIVVPSLVGAVALGGVALGGVASAGPSGTPSGTPSAAAPAKPTVENSAARYIAPAGGAAGSLTFTAKVTDDSGVRSLKVLAWPKSSDLKPTAAEVATAESATCEKSSARTSACTYTLKVTPREAAELPEGVWNVSVLATAKDGDTAFVPEAATFSVPR
ncbi:DUF5707 domain-containing protein [Streptomyces sp. NPDC093099]|uniref:DUF5707 domain-containing protein n=1 Tax=Streptomyces sp. NPDC093099 TaxID=3366028 RepID=UPI00380AD1EE